VPDLQSFRLRIVYVEVIRKARQRSFRNNSFLRLILEHKPTTNMKKKSILSKASISSLALLPLISTAYAGDVMTIDPNSSVVSAGRTLKDAIPSISNPTLHELAVPQTRIHGMIMHQQLPDTVSLANGTVQAPLGGDLNLVALQIEYALNDRLSIIASKDGFIDLNPDTTVPGANGFANLAAGLKYAFIYDTANNFAASVSLSLELPTGNRDVYQGYGDGAANLTVSVLKLKGPWQFSGATGVHIPFDSDAESTTGFASGHVSYQLTEKFTPIFEVNLYRTLSTGNGTENFLSPLTDFEGGDLINLGGINSKVNQNIVTAAAGFRYKFCDKLSVGAAYEIPLTNDEDNLMKSRVTVDFVYKF